MKSRGTAGGLLLALLLLPAGASAMSFGSFAPGEQIITLDVGQGTASYDGAGTLTVSGWITSIATNQPRTIDLAQNQLTFSIVMTKVVESNSPGNFALAAYTSAGSDLVLLDTLGGGQVYAGDFDPNLIFQAIQGGTLTGTLGALNGERAVFNTDFAQGAANPIDFANFSAAMGPVGDMLLSLTDFGTNTVCGILVSCAAGAAQAAWSTPATGSIDPPAGPVPEPQTLWLLGAALGALAMLRRKS